MGIYSRCGNDRYENKTSENEKPIRFLLLIFRALSYFEFAQFVFGS